MKSLERGTSASLEMPLDSTLGIWSPTCKVIFIKMRQNHNFETWRIEGECFQESLIIPLNSTSSHSHLRQR